MKLAPKRRSWCCRSIAAKRKVDLGVVVRLLQREKQSVSSLSLATQLKIFNDIHDSSINPILNLLTQVQISEDNGQCTSGDPKGDCVY